MSDRKQTVTFGIIAYNEHKYLPDLLSDLLKQTYRKELIEIVLVDGGSSDNTWEIMKDFKNTYADEYKIIKILRNPKRIQAAGWNVVINNSTSEVLVRIDAHARIPEDFIEQNMRCINFGEFVCGGPRENIIDEDTSWKQVLLDAEQSMFGSGIASYRQKTAEKRYVKSVFLGAYRREVIDNVGLFNEKLIRTEDNEYHYRIREAGYKICYDPRIKSFYQTRSTLRGMLKQKYWNGFWIGRTLSACPKCLSIFHLMPFAFVLSLVLSFILMAESIYQPVVTICAVYGVFLILNILAVFWENRNVMDILLPAVIFLIHCSYGLGTLVGIFSK